MTTESPRQRRHGQPPSRCDGKQQTLSAQCNRRMVSCYLGVIPLVLAVASSGQTFASVWNLFSVRVRPDRNPRSYLSEIHIEPNFKHK